MATTLERKGGKKKLPSNEQSVVDQFTTVIRKHQDQAPTTLARLVGLAFEFTLGPGESREDKLARAQVRGLGARPQSAEAEGGSWSSDDVARLLQISKTAVLKRLAAGRLLAWREAGDFCGQVEWMQSEPNHGPSIESLRRQQPRRGRGLARRTQSSAGVVL